MNCNSGTAFDPPKKKHLKELDPMDKIIHQQCDEYRGS